MTITLLSDLGVQDASVAVARGVLLQHIPAATVIDVTHEVRPFNRAQAAYLLGSAYKNFAHGTIHVALFDLFATAPARVIVSSHAGHYFITSDNGLLPMALGQQPEQSWQAAELNGDDAYATWLHAAGQAVALLQSQQPGDASWPAYTLKDARIDPPRISGNIAECDIIHIDHFENVITNMTRTQFDTLRGTGTFTLEFMEVEELTEVSHHYSDVGDGMRLCRFNGSGYLEICVNHGNAASLCGLKMGSRHNKLKIIFE